MRKKKNKKTQRKETFPHFRHYLKGRHPALIVGEQADEEEREEYRFRKVMHSDHDGKHLNEKVFPNPNPKDKEPMYIGKRVRHDLKKFFSGRLPWLLPKKRKPKGNKKK